MEVVNSVSGSCRRKKTSKVGGDSSSVPAENFGGDEACIQRVVTSPEPPLIPVGEVVRTSQYGVDLILGDTFGDEMEDVELLEDNRSDAEHILEIQLDLGLSFKEGNEATVDRLVGLEERDRENLARCQESHGFQ
jgi:hypothetical protein